MTTLWDTTGTEVVQALAAERRMAGFVASGLALTLVVVVEEGEVRAAEQAATHAAAQHPCRLVVVVRRRPDAPDPRLDAEVSVGGRLGPGEAVVLRMYGRLALHAESVVLPLLAPDAPVVTWWFGHPPNRIAHDPLGVFADRRLTDCALAADPMAALARRADDYAPGDTDLSWTRTTPWRALCAAAFDAAEGTPRSVQVTGGAGEARRALLAGWLSRRLDLDVAVLDAGRPGIQQIRFEGDDGELLLSRQDERTVAIQRPGHDRRVLPLPHREVGELLAEELRRLDPDDIYAEALERATGTAGLSARPRRRTHIWHDPVVADDPDPALTTS